ncbi:hypothetical protein CPAST_c34940 [Clostridium pasteurianum DSM 525 = ATCC 6013]|uniref:Uncharacterized protein n=1 Tax=Clostridium pasteurianum DSM 525 = ATCC 6013 TaxID=1262449 RepID=A0A0H3JBD8_CLOPA|nr:hypothetical protein [Clostridium pasteurianum]AJA49555.1 hypothetical protein CPAST_c34940 [Clostridium pasteurianum DSM 525 = ATCC 6013]AJA53543.1 hypothetical protein CLPA_c34940 [Clostridium pasteurianum DSM 525 = ATCC 6013]AOZ76709.1 hypothetical protein AQ983_16965 [Clostridium pasteurianum DSM 525 = ATCC 6013]AOZ80506.1 hypothetical protein AQ984_16960 [Clostridium pasteurianum]ELP58929.1 hypothetical protein F502_12411 [Clostridium pasteurianum DSM 525 = ATCC 6013]
MFLKDGNYNEFGIEVSFNEFELYLNEISEETITLDIHGIVQTQVTFEQFCWYINEYKHSNKRTLVLEDLTESICSVFIDMKDIKHIIKGVHFYEDSYILILKHNIMYRLIVEY